MLQFDRDCILGYIFHRFFTLLPKACGVDTHVMELKRLYPLKLHFCDYQ